MFSKLRKCDDYDYDDSSAYKIPRGLPEHHPGFIPLRLPKIMALLTSVTYIEICWVIYPKLSQAVIL